MGYFGKPIRRGKARRAKETFLAPTQAIDPAQWKAAPASPEEVPARYFRLRVDFGDDGMWGLFGGCRRIRQDNCTSAGIVRSLSREVKWFGAHLIAPRRVPQDAVFWFATDADSMCGHAWKLIRLIQKAGAKVFIESSDKPGRIVYRDEHQVAAIRFSDAPAIRDATLEIERRHG